MKVVRQIDRTKTALSAHIIKHSNPEPFQDFLLGTGHLDKSGIDIPLNRLVRQGSYKKCEVCKAS